MMKNAELDPIELEIAWGQLVAIIDEAALALVQTAFSAVVREAKDYTIVLMDTEGRVIAQPTVSAPAFNGTMPRTMRHFLERVPPAGWRPDDLIVTNDPWMGTGHLNDVNSAFPIFYDGNLICFVGVVAHMADIGGIIWSAAATEVFEEGIQIPILKLFDAGKPNDTAFAFIRQNVRQPEIVTGDLYAMYAAAEVVARGLYRFLDGFGEERWPGLCTEIWDRSEAVIRKEIRAFKDGTYAYQIDLDGRETPLKIMVTVTVEGDTIFVDYEGTSPQVAYGINSPFCYTFSYTCYSLKCLCNPDVPNNDGTFRAFQMKAPEGSILNPRYPAPTAARPLAGQPVYAALFGALAEVVPDRVIAECSTPRPTVIVNGVGTDGQRFHSTFFFMGGLGAWAKGDGGTCLPFPTNIQSTPIEVAESNAPLLFECKALVPDSGGAGRWRGGLGQEVVIRNLSPNRMRLSIMSERTKQPPQGRFGGKPGGLPRFDLADGTEADSKGISWVEPDENITIRSHGGGGFGAPEDRPAEIVATDLVDGYITDQAAKEVYGR